jgi:hypothetical protein
MTKKQFTPPALAIQSGRIPENTKTIIGMLPSVGLRLFLNLTPYEAALLQFIYSAEGTCSFENIYKNVSQSAHLRGKRDDTNLLIVHIARVNKKLSPYGVSVENVRGVGYFLSDQAKSKLVRVATDLIWDALAAETLAGGVTMLPRPRRTTTIPSPPGHCSKIKEVALA